MGANQDFSDMFRTLNAAGVRYLVAGAYAVIHHTEPRYTKDIDIWVLPSPENASRVYRALSEFGAPLEGVSERDFTDRAVVYQIGIEPNRIDILMEVGDLDFEECWARAVDTTYDGHPIRVLALDDVLRAKSGTGRLEDRLDVQRLRRARSLRRGLDRQPRRKKGT